MLLSELPKVYDRIGSELSVLKEDDEYFYCLPSYTKEIKIPKKVTFNTKLDAMYWKFVQDDSPVENYKSSKYYKYYIERAGKEDPDRLI